jgi:hypothetical protein
MGSSKVLKRLYLAYVAVVFGWNDCALAMQNEIKYSTFVARSHCKFVIDDTSRAGTPELRDRRKVWNRSGMFNRRRDFYIVHCGQVAKCCSGMDPCLETLWGFVFSDEAEAMIAEEGFGRDLRLEREV